MWVKYLKQYVLLLCLMLIYTFHEVDKLQAQEEVEKKTQNNRNILPITKNKLEEEREAYFLNKEGIRLSNSSEFSKAVTNFKKAVKSSRSKKVRAISYNNLAYQYMIQKKYKLAIRNYQKSLKEEPRLIIPRQNLGRLLYEQKRYEEAVKQGEVTLELDPKNKEVPKWLEIARKKISSTKLEKKQAAEYFSLEVGYHFSSLFRQVKTRSVQTITQGALKLPMGLYLDVKPAKNIQFYLGLRVPFMGALNPPITIAEEELRAIYWFKNLYFGLGILFIQGDFRDQVIPGKGNDIPETGDIRLNKDINVAEDIKGGIILGSDQKKYILQTIIYPRYFIREKSNRSHGISLDRNLISIDIKSKTLDFDNIWAPKVHGEFKVNEWYITEYETSLGPLIGHYIGYYDLNIGLILGDIQSKLYIVPFEIEITWTNRLYFLDLNDNDPFAFGNGQGFFGLSTEDSLEGEPFAGFRSNAHGFRLSSRQLFFDRFILEETFEYEFTVQQPFNAFIFSIKASIIF